jgi:TolB-like protein/class 3 adenylate cyclase/Tfp pilus assembly protein PilF
MAAEVKKEIELEIAHVLFIDTVDYSKLLIDEQRDLIDTLKQVVRGADEFRSADAAGKLIKVATGDGMALVFYNRPEAPVECALQISRALKEHPELKLRMGVHSGPVSGVIDVNERANVAGAGINVARRVMDCGDAGHILLSQHVADDLEQYGRWRQHLHDLGECEVKHGVHVHVFNLYTDELGNPELPEKFRPVLSSESAKKSATLKWAFIIGAGVLIIAASLFMFDRSRAIRLKSPSDQAERDALSLPVPEKSIAVLPFESPSEDKADAYFADGIQDEILTRLSKISDLKVISRSSTQTYKNAPRNLREIAQQLGVSSILEGRVQKSADQVRVTVQLINAANDSHLWAESYDRKFSDIFQVESDVAQKIGTALEAKLTGREKRDISSVGTQNPQAYDAYLQARAVYREWTNDSLQRAVQALEQAVRLDSDFAAAWALLARMRAFAYFSQLDQTETGRTAARKAAETAIRLQPDLAEAQMARGFYEYWVMGDYDAARGTFEQVQLRWPNNADMVEALGLIAFRQGRWKEAREYFDAAIALNPRDLFLRLNAFYARAHVRDFPAALRTIDQALAIWPDDASLIASKASVYQALGDLDRAGSLLSRLRSKPEDFDDVVEAICDQAMLRRDPTAAITLLQTWTKLPNSLPPLSQAHYKLHLGELEGLSGNANEAWTSFTQARQALEKGLQQQPQNGVLAYMLARTLADLGEREAALRCADRAVELVPSSHDARSGPYFEEMRARIQARFGDGDRAIPTLKHLLEIPYGGEITPALLRLHPDFDQLRSDPRFQKLCKDK